MAIGGSGRGWAVYIAKSFKLVTLVVGEFSARYTVTVPRQPLPYQGWAGIYSFEGVPRVYPLTSSFSACCLKLQGNRYSSASRIQ